jgi:hypothetical protein
MNKKYERYISYIVDDIESPYFINMRDNYGLKQEEYELVLSKVFNQPVVVRNYRVYDSNNNEIYFEGSDGSWVKYEYDDNGNLIYSETSDGDIIDRRYE